MTLNRDHLAAEAIVELAHLDDALIERIQTAVATWDRAPLLVMLFGSAATGQMRVDSDIDVFVVGSERGDEGDEWRAQISELEFDLTKWTGNDARVLAYSCAPPFESAGQLMASRTTECTPAIRDGRMAKARQFVEAAETVEALADDANDVADAYVTLCVHAGIAAADVICCKRLGALSW